MRCRLGASALGCGFEDWDQRNRCAARRADEVAIDALNGQQLRDVPGAPGSAAKQADD